MSISDEEFREQFKPLHIPAHYAADDTDEHKVVFALAQLGEGAPYDVARELHEIDGSNNIARFEAIASSLLNSLYEKGLVKGMAIDGAMHYNLSKITEANDGAVNPDLLAPGLD